MFRFVLMTTKLRQCYSLVKHKSVNRGTLSVNQGMSCFYETFNFL